MIKKLKIYKITPLHIEWNIHNGFILDIFGLESNKIDNSLFGIFISRDFFIINVFFKYFIVYEKNI